MIVTEKDDLKTILYIQKEAFKTEAVKHNDMGMPPMTETAEQVEKAFDDGSVFFKYSENGEIIGSVRANLENDVCHIGRLVVKPGFQNKGIGKALMLELEFYFKNKCRLFKIFTGEKSEHALALYSKLGYKITEHTQANGYLLVHMEKENG